MGSGTPIALVWLMKKPLTLSKEIVVKINDQIFGVHAPALQVRQQRMSVIASNIANASTPNYKAQDIDFASAMQMSQAGMSVDSARQYRIPLQGSMDGNTVDLVTEQVSFSENALAYRTSLEFLKGRISTVMRALKGE